MFWLQNICFVFLNPTQNTYKKHLVHVDIFVVIHACKWLLKIEERKQSIIVRPSFLHYNTPFYITLHFSTWAMSF